MGLLSKLKDTKFRSLKFGADRYNGESSNQPYINKGIPDDLPFNSPDILLRGGLNHVSSVIDDEKRLFKFFTDLKSPNGVIFTANQNLLSRIEVQSDAVRLNPGNISTVGGNINQGIYTPTSTLAQAAINGAGGHILKQGLNPIPTNSSLFARLLGDNTKLPTYSGVINLIRESNNNRLVGFLNVKPGFPLYSYNGGPDSVLGIGKTNIYRYSDSGDTSIRPVYKTDFIKSSSDFDTIINNVNFSDNTISSAYSKSFGESIVNNDVNIINSIGSKIESTILNDTLTKEQLIAISDDLQFKSTENYIDYRVLTNNASNKYPSMDYNTYNIDNRLHQGIPGKKKDSYDYSVSAETLIALDKINALPVYTDVKNQTVNDLIKFRIGVFHPNSNVKDYIHFRALLDSFSDSYSSKIETIKYSGRGEDLYKYDGFSRDISLSWTVAAQSKAELIPMYKKLNYLASVCAPTYNGAFMHGNIITLTIGGYLYEQPGYLEGFSYDMSDTTWEIGVGTNSNYDSSVKELPHIIKVSGFKFRPIHNFLPQRLIGTDSPSEGNTKFIALSSGNNDNYSDIYNPINLDSQYNNPNK